MTEITRVFTRLLGGLALVVGVLLWTEAWSVGTYGTYLVGFGLLGGIVWAAWRLGSRRSKKVGVAMATLVVVGGMLSVSLGAPEACADGECSNKGCTRDLQCLVTCPPCNGNLFDPGTCWYKKH